MRFRLFVLFLGLTFAACHPGPVVGGRQPAAGTIAGLVTASDASTPLVGRKVSAVDVTSGRHYDATTGNDGGYSMKVPEGTYRLEVELRSGEALTKKPDETHVKSSDIDADRNFVVMPKL